MEHFHALPIDTWGAGQGFQKLELRCACGSNNASGIGGIENALKRLRGVFCGGLANGDSVLQYFYLHSNLLLRFSMFRILEPALTTAFDRAEIPSVFWRTFNRNQRHLLQIREVPLRIGRARTRRELLHRSLRG